MEGLLCVDDFEKEALSKLEKSVCDYYRSGADDELTVKDNRDSFSRILIRPRILRDVSNRDLSTTILGKKVSVPLGISPTAMQRLAHPDGECGSAKATEIVGGILILSFFSTSSYEEVAAASPNVRKWFQFYMHKDRSINEAVFKRAEKAGFEALVLTVDAQYVGKRRASEKNPIQFPSHLRLPNAVPDEEKLDVSKVHDSIDHSVTWEGFKLQRMPYVQAAELGVDAIIVSNHGGRQIDTAPATIDILPSIVRAVDNRLEVYLDSGIRRGTDIFKALALGAKMVFVGRPAIWGLAVDGAKGAKRVMEILRDELDLTMALTGVADIKSITSKFVCTKDSLLKL
ncbi:Hydroxyacid oxidase 1 [Orchesella cincta]|uniref:(S)-2-hydroxy-acid oxidase n=1 Tax=Orchesella cincta TaxID=48709 RepID=A0A1D2MNM9_ORCCI|nr:Hydroxyacid oxidase 1 [Orchesella cincta]